MWEYSVATEDEACDIADMFALHTHLREGKAVLSSCPPGRADKLVSLCGFGRVAWTVRKIPMPKALAAKMLGEIEEGNERAHVKADLILLACIDDPNVSLAFDAIDKWYS